MTDKTKRALVIRLGAIGDCIIITPLIKYLHDIGWEVIVNTNDTGMQVLKNNPNISKFIFYPDNSVENHKLMEYFLNVFKKHDCTRMFNLTESLETKLVLHPSFPQYNFTKQERYELCNKNYYEYTFEHVGLDYRDALSMGINLIGDLYFETEEIDSMVEITSPYVDVFKILLPISGSGLNKIYPYWEEIFDNIYKYHKNFKIFTVGDETCRLIEAEKDYIIQCSGKWSIRQSLIAPRFMDLAIGTDTGVMHAAGTCDVPKILLLGHDTKENISKTFLGKTRVINSTVNCAPCFRLIYDSQVQCPRYESIGVGCLCMTGQWDYKTGGFIAGIHPDLVKSYILEEINSWEKQREGKRRKHENLKKKKSNKMQSVPYVEKSQDQIIV